MTQQSSQKVQKREHIHHKFTEEEDQALKDLVEEHGTNDWLTIASAMPRRNARQCRDRWMNYLQPDLDTSQWTAAEDARLLDLHSQLGSRWVQITRAFPNRTDTMIKNRFHVLQRRKQRQLPCVIQQEAPANEDISPVESLEIEDFFGIDFPLLTLM